MKIAILNKRTKPFPKAWICALAITSTTMAQPTVTAITDGVSGRETSLNGTNNSGVAVGAYIETNGKLSPLIFRSSTGLLDPSLSQSIMNQLNTNNAWLNAVNEQGTMIGNYYDSGGTFRPFWVDVNGIANSLPTLTAGASGEAFEMMGNVIVGSVVNGSGEVEAAYWQHPFSSLNLIPMPPGVTYSLAVDVSVTGKIAGTARQAPDAHGVTFSGFVTDIGSTTPATIFGYPGRNLGVTGINPNGSMVSANLGSGRRDHVRIDTLTLTIQEYPQGTLWTESLEIGGIFDSMIVGMYRDTVG